MKLKLVIFAALLIPALANAYEIKYESHADRYAVTCDNGSFVGWLRIDGSGYWSSQDASTTDKNRDVVIQSMIRNKGNNCS